MSTKLFHEWKTYFASSGTTVKWSFKGHQNTFPYDDKTQKLLEAAFQAKKKTLQFYINNEAYVVDFDKMLQINQRDRTKVRKVVREIIKPPKVVPKQASKSELKKSKSMTTLTPQPLRASKPPPPQQQLKTAPVAPPPAKNAPQPVWSWQEVTGDWRKFDDHLQWLLESRFLDGAETYTFSHHGRLHDVDFNSLTQTLRHTQETSRIRRKEKENSNYFLSTAASVSEKVYSLFRSSSPSTGEIEPTTSRGHERDSPPVYDPEAWQSSNGPNGPDVYQEGNSEILEKYFKAGGMSVPGVDFQGGVGGNFHGPTENSQLNLMPNVILGGHDNNEVPRDQALKIRDGSVSTPMEIDGAVASASSSQIYFGGPATSNHRLVAAEHLRTPMETRIEEAPKTSYVWFFKNEADDAWTRYDESNQVKLETAYMAGHDKASISNGNDYLTVKFKEMKQYLYYPKPTATAVMRLTKDVALKFGQIPPSATLAAAHGNSIATENLSLTPFWTHKSLSTSGKNQDGINASRGFKNN